MIKFHKVTKTYGESPAEIEALKAISLNIESKEFVAITGTSGCGKSTLLHIMGLLDSQTEGDYFLNDENASKISQKGMAKLRNTTFGFVFQSFNLIEEKTAIENVILPLKYSKVNKKEWKDKGIKTMKMLGIEHLAYKYSNQLSGGEQQRVAIARAIVNNPKIILADEPTGNLDSKTGQEIIAIFKKLCTEQGKTIIVVTHDYKVATFANRIIQMSDGRIINDNIIKDQEIENLYSFNDKGNYYETHI